MGHTSDSYSEPLFMQLLLGGIMYAASPPPAATLSIRSFTATLDGRRVALILTVMGCTSCSARATLTVASGKRVIPLRLAGGVAKATTPVLPPGRATIVLSVSDSTSGLTRTAQRSVRVR